MKKAILYFLAAVFALHISSCSNDFLAENKKTIDGYELDAALNVVPTAKFTEVSVMLPDLKNKPFRVLQYPQIIHFESFHGVIDDEGKLSFNIKVDGFNTDVSPEPQIFGYIILNIENFGLLQITVQYINYGTPVASISPEFIDFDISTTPSEFEFRNKGNGVLLYRFVEIPSWVEIRVSHIWDADPVKLSEELSLYQYGNLYYKVTPITDGLSPGEHDGKIVIETSDPDHPQLTVKVKIRVRDFLNPESMIPIDGVVVDAAMDKSTNTMALVTQNPAKLITYNVNTGEKKEKSLSKNPFSVNLSADNKTIFVGQENRFEFVELSSLESKDFEQVDFDVASIVDGENGYYYLGSRQNKVFSFDPVSKSIKEQAPIDGSHLIKINGKPQLASTRATTSPNGLYFVDISEPDDVTLVKYWHQGFGRRLIVSEDQKYLFSFSSFVYHFPGENSEDINLAGEMYSNLLGRYNIHFDWMHHSAASGSIWGSYEFYSQSVYKYKTLITRFNDQTFGEGESYFLNDYVTTINGKKDYYLTIAPFFFATGNGGKLALVKNVREYNANAWHIEVIDVSN